MNTQLKKQPERSWMDLCKEMWSDSYLESCPAWWLLWALLVIRYKSCELILQSEDIVRGVGVVGVLCESWWLACVGQGGVSLAQVSVHPLELIGGMRQSSSLSWKIFSFKLNCGLAFGSGCIISGIPLSESGLFNCRLCRGSYQTWNLQRFEGLSCSCAWRRISLGRNRYLGWRNTNDPGWSHWVSPCAASPCSCSSLSGIPAAFFSGFKHTEIQAFKTTEYLQPNTRKKRTSACIWWRENVDQASQARFLSFSSLHGQSIRPFEFLRECLVFRFIPLGVAGSLLRVSLLLTVTVLARIILKEKVTVVKLIAIILSIVAIFLVVQPTFIFGSNESGLSKDTKSQTTNSSTTATTGKPEETNEQQITPQRKHWATSLWSCLVFLEQLTQSSKNQDSIAFLHSWSTSGHPLRSLSVLWVWVLWLNLIVCSFLLTPQRFYWSWVNHLQTPFPSSLWSGA